MENSRILVDTSVIIDHLRKIEKDRSVLYGLMKKYDVCISVVTEFELFAGARNEQKKRDVQTIIDLCYIFPFSSETARESAKIYDKLRNTNQIIEIRDIFIASTAIVQNVPISTLNIDHFKRIEHLNLLETE